MRYVVKANYTSNGNDPSTGVNCVRQRDFYCFMETNSLHKSHLMEDAKAAARKINPDAQVIEVVEAKFEFNKVCKVVVKKKVNDEHVSVSFGKPEHGAAAAFSSIYGYGWTNWFVEVDNTGLAEVSWDFSGLLQERDTYQNGNALLGLIPDTFRQYSTTPRWDLYVVGGFIVDPKDKDWKITTKEKVKEALEEYAEAKKRAIEDAVEASFAAVNNKVIRYR